MADWLGWLSSIILLLTLTGQVVKQWRDDSVKGVSRWLFFGQISASIGFIIYSILLENLVFTVTNSLILTTAIAGEIVYVLKKRRATAQNAASGE